MTVIIHIGRRVPKSWFRRGASKVKGLLTFQENIWQIIVQSFKKAKKKANADGRMKFILEREDESEDMHYKIEWIKMVIQGNKEMEEEEYNDCLKFYDKLSSSFKKEFPVDNNLAKQFKTKKLTGVTVDEAYKKGYGSMGNNNIANKLLEMGILMHIDWKKDFDSRDEFFI